MPSWVDESVSWLLLSGALEVVSSEPSPCVLSLLEDDELDGLSEALDDSLLLVPDSAELSGVSSGEFSLVSESCCVLSPLEDPAEPSPEDDDPSFWEGSGAVLFASSLGSVVPLSSGPGSSEGEAPGSVLCSGSENEGSGHSPCELSPLEQARSCELATQSVSHAKFRSA